MTRSRVLWVTNLAPPYRRSLWRALVPEFDLHVRLLSASEPNRSMWTVGSETGYALEPLGTRTIHVAGARLYVARRGELERLGTAWDAVVVGGWESPAHVQTLSWARRHGLGVVLHAAATRRSTTFTAPPVRGLKRRIHEMATAILAYGRAAERYLVEDLRVRVPVVRGFNAVDGEEIAASAAAVRHGDPVRTSGHRFVYVGQLIPRKNVGTLLEAAETSLGSDDTLDIIGEGPERPELERQARSGRIAGRVQFLGPLDHAAAMAHLARCHTLVLPSAKEVWGLVVNEALAAGLHVVASASCGVVDDLAHEPRLFVAAGDRGSLAAALRRSRSSWSGWSSPPTSHLLTIEHSANGVLEVVNLARARSALAGQRTKRTLP